MRFTVFAGLVFLLTVSAFAADRRTERALKEGLRLEAAGQFASAEQTFTEVIAQDPSEGTAYLHRGRIRLLTSRAKEAMEGIKDYDRAIELGLDSATVYNSRAAAEMSLGRPKDAIRDYSHGIKLRLDDPEPIKRRGNAYLKL